MESPASLLRYFRYDQLPPRLQQVSRPFGLLAKWMAENLPDTGQTRLAAQKLLEAKDCAVRAAVDHPEVQIRDEPARDG